MIFSAFVIIAASMPAFSAALTDYAENKLIDALLRGQSIGTPATWYIGVTTDTCSDSTAGSEPSGGNYSRVSVTAGLSQWSGTQSSGSTTASSGTGGTSSNNASITWPTSTASWGNLQAVRWYDASSSGNSWICINLSSPYNVSAAGITVSFQSGQLQFQIDN